MLPFSRMISTIYSPSKFLRLESSIVLPTKEELDAESNLPTRTCKELKRSGVIYNVVDCCCITIGGKVRSSNPSPRELECLSPMHENKMHSVESGEIGEFIMKKVNPNFEGKALEEKIKKGLENSQHEFQNPHKRVCYVTEHIHRQRAGWLPLPPRL